MNKMNHRFILSIILLLTCLLSGSVVYGQALTGTKTICSSGCDYPTVSAAVTTLNNNGVGTGGVTFNVSAGHTEALTRALVVTATGSSANPVVFQKAGTGANPLITAFTGSKLASSTDSVDVIWAFEGSDYITIDGINLIESASNVSQAEMMEVGLGFYKTSGTNGTSNNTIRNNTITLNRNNITASAGVRGNATGSVGVEFINATRINLGTAITVTSASGSSSDNRIYSNTIQNCNFGISFIGFAAPSPYTLADLNNDIGGNSASTGNTIINFGGGTSPTTACGAIYISNQWSYNISYNTINNNTGSGINHAVSNRGIWLFASSVGSSCNIKRNTISISGGIATGSINWCLDFEAAQSGANGNTINIDSNQFLNCNVTAASTAAFTAIWLNTAASVVNVRGNSFYGFSYAGTGTTQVILSQLACGTLNILNNTIDSTVLTGATATGTHYNIGVTIAPTVAVNINNNTVTRTILNTVGTGTKTLYGIYYTGSTPSTNMLDNTVNDLTRNGTSGGTTIGIYQAGGANGTSTTTVKRNTVSNLSISGSGTTSTMYGIQVSTGTIICDSNIVFNLSCLKATGSGNLYGIYDISSPNNENYNNNLIYNITHAGTGIVYGLYTFTTTGTRTVSGNTIYNLTTAGVTLAGIMQSSSSPTIFKNKVYNLQCNSTGSPIVSGILISSLATSAVANIYNNIIGDLKAPAASVSGPTAPAIRGISILVTAAPSTINLSHNSVFLNASSTGVNFGTTALFVTTATVATTANLTARNNIFVNTSTPSGTGLTAAYQRTSTSILNYNDLSNSNLFFAGTPAANRLIYYDGTNLDQTLSAYKTRITPKDSNSISELPNFLSTTGSNAQFLKIDPTILTGIEAAGQKITTITTDYEGNIRAGNPGYTGTSGLPDLGAFEGNYIGDPSNQMVFDSSNTIQMTGVVPLGSANNRILRVQVYSQKGFNSLLASSFKLNTAGSTSAANISQAKVFFTGSDTVFNTNTLFGTTASPSGSFYVNGTQRLITGVNNFWVTYDISGTATPGNFLDAQLDSMVLSGTNYSPIDGNPAGNRTIQSPLSGSYNIGTGQVYTTITAAISDLMLLGVSAPVTFILKDALYNTASGETFPIVLSGYRNASATNTVTIVPDLGLATTIESNNTTATIDMNGVSNFIIDGRQGATGGFVSGNNLIIRNTSLAAPAIRFINDADSNRVLYTDLRSSNIIALASANAGVVNFGTTNGTNGNDFNLIKFCDIRDDASGQPIAGVHSLGSATTLATNNDNNTIDSCNIYNFFNAASATAGIYVGQNNNQWTINGNHLFQTVNRTYTGAVTHRVFWITPNVASLTSASGFNITNNFIGGNSANGSGVYTTDGTSSYFFNGMDISVGIGAVTNIRNNTITNINTTSNNTASNTWVAINLANGNVSTADNIIGSASTPASITYTTTSTGGGGLIGVRVGGGSTHSVRKNVIAGISVNGNATTSYAEFFGINLVGSNNIDVDSNVIGSLTMPASIVHGSTSSTSTIASRMSGIFATNSSGTNPVVNITNNIVANIQSNINAPGAQATSLKGIHVIPTIAGTYNVSRNLVADLYTATATTGSGLNCAILGIAVSSTAGVYSVTENTIRSLQLNGTSTTAAVQNAGIFFSVPASGNNIIARNFIHSQSLTANNPFATVTGIDAASGLMRIINNNIRLGIDTSGTGIATACIFRGITKNSGNASIYFNSVYIGGSNVNTDLNRTFAFQRTGAGTDEVLNNIFVNTRTNQTTGAGHFAVNLNNNTTLTMNTNLLRADSVGLYNNIAYLSMSNWKAGSAIDASSIFGLAGFINANGSASSVNLKINPSNPTPIEATGTAVSGTGIDIDIDGDLRSSLTPTDIGSDAGNFTSLDIAGPSVTYTALANDTVTGNRIFNATITDATGVYVSSTTLRPRVYFRKSFSGSWNSTQGVRISGTPSNGNWQFTINASLAGGLTGGDSIYYFVIAQDSTVSNNIGSLPGGAEATDVNTINVYPTPYVYRVLPIISGTFTVGSGGNFTTLTANDGFFNFINSSVIGSNINVQITSDIEEPGTIGLNQFTETGNGGYKMRIMPASATLTSLTGSITTNNSAVIRINGADRLTIDGSFAGSGRYLRIMNRTLNAATLNLLNDATKDTIMNCIFEGVNNTVGTLNLFAPAAGGTGNDSNVIMNCLFRDTLGAVMTLASGLNKPNTGVFSQTSNAAVGNDYNQIINCEFNNIRYNAINISTTGGDYWNMYGNKIYSSNDSNFVNLTWIQINGGGGHIIRNNSMGGSAPDRSGPAMVLRGTGQNMMIFLSTTSPLTSTIDSNVVGNIFSNSTATQFYGYRLSGKCNARANYFGGAINPWDTILVSNTIYSIISGANEIQITNNVVGNVRNTSTSGITAGIYGSSGSYTIRNNTVRDISQPFTGTLTAASGPIGIYALPNAGENDTIDGNTVYNINAGATGLYAKGIQAGTSSSNVITITRNRIYNITTAVDNNLAAAVGFMYTLSGVNNFANNQISLGANTSKRVIGIFNNGTTPGILNAYANTIHINGLADSTSFGIYNGNTGSVNAWNNMIYNSRRDALNNDRQYAIGAATVTPTAANLNYNLFVVNDTAAIAELGGIPQSWTSIGTLYTTSYQTNWAENTNNVPAQHVFSDTLTGNLNPVTNQPAAWLMNGKAKRIIGQTGDFNNLSGVRSASISAGASDIGSVEFTPSSTPASAYATGNIASGDSTQLYIASRLVAKIVWGSAGTLPTAIDARYYSGSNPANTPVASSSMNAYWNIQPTGGSGYDYTLTLMQDSAVLGTVANPNNLAIARYEGTGTNWMRINPTTVNQVSGNMRGTAATRLGIFTGTDITNNPLPVEFTLFNAHAAGKDVALNWETASETNNYGFYIERSEDGQHFETIDFVKGNGQTAGNYGYTDINPFRATNILYYRLRQTDYDGTISFTNTIMVMQKTVSGISLSVFPNPYQADLNVSLNTQTPATAKVVITNIQGKELFSGNYSVEAGNNTITIHEAQTLSSGVYFIKTSLHGEVQTLKLIKK